MGLSNLFGLLGEDTDRRNHGETVRQSNGDEYEKVGDTVIRHTEDTQAHTTWHWGRSDDSDTPSVRCVNVHDDKGNCVSSTEYDSSGEKIES